MLAVILCGGSGTRLWPVSREAVPKPFMKIGGGRSLLQRTALRARALGAEDCVVVTNAEYTFKTAEEFAALGKEGPAACPVAAGTDGPQYGAGHRRRLRSPGQARSGRRAADHPARRPPHPGREALRRRGGKRGSTWPSEGKIVLFGIQPTLPETGFGYIECAAVPKGDEAQLVRRFVEKPTPEKAAEYLWPATTCGTAGCSASPRRR